VGVRYDLEMLLEDVKSAMTTHFNTVVGLINTEKNDGIALDTLNADAYFLQQLNGKMANWNPVCLYGVDTIETKPNGPHGLQRFQLSVIIIVADSGEEIEFGKRMFRYSRALEEVFRRGWTGGRGSVKFEVSSLVPIPLTNLNSSETYRAVGVELNGVLA
jgi:hypothetical protein